MRMAEYLADAVASLPTAQASASWYSTSVKALERLPHLSFSRWMPTALHAPSERKQLLRPKPMTPRRLQNHHPIRKALDEIRPLLFPRPRPSALHARDHLNALQRLFGIMSARGSHVCPPIEVYRRPDFDMILLKLRHGNIRKWRYALQVKRRSRHKDGDGKY